MSSVCTCANRTTWVHNATLMACKAECVQSGVRVHAFYPREWCVCPQNPRKAQAGKESLFFVGKKGVVSRLPHPGLDPPVGS